MLRGPTPATAPLGKVLNKVPMAQLTRWVQKLTTAQDVTVVEAESPSVQREHVSSSSLRVIPSRYTGRSQRQQGIGPGYT